MRRKIICLCILGMFLLMSATTVSGFDNNMSYFNVDLKNNGQQISFFGDPPIEEWTKTFGGKDYDHGNSIYQTDDGGFIIAGETYSFGAGGRDIWLIKTDSEGNMQWNKTFGGPDGEACGISGSVQQTSDGGYIITGSKIVPYHLNDFWLIKTDSEGNKEWDKTFGGINSDAGYSVRQTSDGGYIIIGDTGLFLDKILLIKTDGDGNKLWEKKFGGLGLHSGTSIQQTSDGGYIIAGLKADPYQHYDVWLVKTDSMGNKEWDKTFGGSDEDGGYSVQQTLDGGYAIMGVTYSSGTGSGNGWLIKTDNSGNKLWEKRYGRADSENIWSGHQTIDGGYIMGGQTNSVGAGGTDVWLIKTDNSGNKLWEKTFGGTKYDTTWSIQQTIDGGYCLAGTTDSFGAGSNDIFLIKASDFENQRPESMVFEGPITGKIGETIEYTLSATDPNGDDVYYCINWGDCSVDEWIGPYFSGDTVKVSHTWSKRGNYNIKAKSEDIYGGESDWVELTVTMPRNRAIQTPFLNFLENHPILYQLLLRFLRL